MLAGALRGVPGKHNGVCTTLSKGNGIRGSAERGHPTRFSLYDGRIGFAFHHLQQRAHRVLQLATVRRVRTEVRQQADDNQRVGGVRMLVMERVRVGYQHPVDVVDVGKRLVCSIPTLGIRCTDAWYSMYQSLVLAVPMFGIRRTCLWYLPYQVPVQNWYH